MCMCGNRTCIEGEQEQVQILVYIMAAVQCLWKADTETLSCSAKDYNLSIQIPPQYPCRSHTKSVICLIKSRVNLNMKFINKFYLLLLLMNFTVYIERAGMSKI